MRLYRNESYSRLSILNSNTFNIEWYCRSQCDNAPILQRTNAPHHNVTTH